MPDKRCFTVDRYVGKRVQARDQHEDPMGGAGKKEAKGKGAEAEVVLGSMLKLHKSRNTRVPRK